MRRFRFLALLLIASACARPDYAESRPQWLLLAAGPQPGYAIKRVIQKDPSYTLVAEDGSVCRTSRERYVATRKGDWIACFWSLPVLDSMALADAS